MRRFAPALGGRLSRRNIALSPHLWSATAAMFAIVGVATGLFPFLTDAFVASQLWALAGVLLGISAVMLATRPPEPGTLATHAVLASVYLCTAGAMVAYGPHGSAPIIVGLFTGPLLAAWLRSRRAVALHLTAASVAFLGATQLGGNDLGTLFAALCFVPSMWVLAGCCMAVLDAVERQGTEHERLALRDPLTGAGNRAYLDDALAVEVARHLSAGSSCTLVQLQLEGFPLLNARLGRATGDGVLATVAAVLAESAPDQAAVARITGDRFAVLLPDTDAEAAAAFVDRARRRLALVDAGGQPLATRAGTATFPEDGQDPASLLDLSTTRCDRDLVERRPRPATGQRKGALTVHLHDDLPVEQRVPAGTPSPDAARDPWADQLIDRRAFVSNRLVWRLVGAFFLFYSAVGATGLLVDDTITGPAPWGAVLLGVLIGLWVLATRPPMIDTRRNHAVIAASYAMPVVAMASCAPQSSWCVGMGGFAGALIGCRLVDRRLIGAHLVAMTVLVAAAGLLVPVDAASVVAMLALLQCNWVLAACYVTILEPAEAQAHRMAELVLRDPLTGAGNARLLRERLDAEVPRHTEIQMPLVVAAIQLTGLDDLARHHGPGATAEALRDVAVLLASIAGPMTTVARVGDDTFHLLIPLTDAEDVRDALRDVRLAVAGSSRRGKGIAPRIGTAVFPEDGVDGTTLIASATVRMAADDPRAHDLSIAPDDWDATGHQPAIAELPTRRLRDRPAGRRSVG